MGSTIVLKFGSSVLRSPDQLSDVVHEVYRYLRDGHRVVAVLSAFSGATDQLLKDACSFGPESEPHATAALLATGERYAAAHLAIALDRAGIAVRLADPAEVELCALGPPLDAEPQSLNVARFEGLFASAPVVVIPGFFAMDDSGRCVLLGRGGSDRSALFLAHSLRAECVLVKDVQGIYDHDPVEAGPATHRFERISWSDAARFAGRLVQPKALQFALARKLPFRVSAAGIPRATAVGAVTVSPIEIRPVPPPLRIVLLGLGVVGLGVYNELVRRPDLFDVRQIVVRNPARHIAAGIAPKLLRTDALAAIEEPSDVVVELMGGNEPAASAIARALSSGRSVVTANKGLVAQRHDWLRNMGRETDPIVRISATVGGAVPMIEVVRRISADRNRAPFVTTLHGIVNGTCNFVLEQLEHGATLPDAVALAQAKGFAEADPRFDLSGEDAAAKLTILARLLIGDEAPRVHSSGIDDSTAARARQVFGAGRRLRLLASMTHANSTPRLRVSLAELTADEWLTRFCGEENALEIVFSDGSRERVWGKGAGRHPASVSVMADIYDAWRFRLRALP